MKKLLLITEGFYHYDRCIANEIEKCGFEVTLLQVNVSVNYSEKLFHRRHLEEYLELKKQEMQKFLLQENLKFDVVLVICGHSVSVEVFRKFRKIQKNAEFILYLWDDIARVKTYNKIKDCFDKIITFDRCDALNFNLQFRPLFFLQEYRYDNREKIYDICFIGQMHSNRKTVLNEIVSKYRKKNLRVFIYLFTGVYTVIKNRICSIWNSNDYLAGHLKMKKLNLEVSTRILLESKTTIDIPHGTQKGLTIRTLESLASKTKLITTNKEIFRYNFYNKENVMVIEADKPIIEEEFLRTPWKEVEPEIIEMYSIESWVKDILADEIQTIFVSEEEGAIAPTL